MKQLFSRCIVSIIFMAAGNLCALDKIFIMKNYVAKISGNGVLTVDSGGCKVLKLPLMTFNDKNPKLKLIWPPRRKFTPEIDIKKGKMKVEIKVHYQKHGLVSDFNKKIILLPDSILVKVRAIPFRTFHSCNPGGIELYPDLFNGAKYTAVQKGGTESATLPNTIPNESAYIFNKLDRLSKISFATARIGSVAFDFGLYPHGLADYRAARWSRKYKFHYNKLSNKANTKLSYEFSINFNPGNKLVKSNKIVKQKNKICPSGGILFELSFENEYNAVAKGNGKVLNDNLPKFIEGVSGQGVYFSFGKVLKYAEKNNLDKAKGTISMWVKTLPVPDPYYTRSLERTIFNESGKPRSGGNVMNFFKSSWGGLRFDLKNKGNDMWAAFDIYNWQFSKWHFIAVSWNNKKGVTLYIDGRVSQRSEVNKGRHGLRPLEWLPVPAEFFFLGAKNSAGYAPWNGAMDEIRIFNRDLTSKEIHKEYSRFAKDLLDISIQNQYIFAGENEKCTVKLKNYSKNKIEIMLEAFIYDAKNKEIKKDKIPPITLKAKRKKSIDIPIKLSKPGNYTIKIKYGNQEKSFNIIALPQLENVKKDGKLDLELVQTIDATKPANKAIVYKGSHAIVDSAIGKYLESGVDRHDRFAIGFEVNELDTPYMAVITWPDNAKRSMEILLHASRGKTRYQNHAGLFAGDAFIPSGEMKEYCVIFWPETHKLAFIFMCLEKGYPAAVKDIKIYKIKSKIPRMVSRCFKGSVPAREIGLFFEDPTLPMCFGAGSLFPGFEKTVTRLLDYTQWFGQNIITYPVVWYDGPLYGSEVESMVPSRAVRMHPENYPDYLMRRLEARGMKFNGMLKIKRLESLDDIAIIDEDKVFKGTETIANMRYDNHLQLITSWNTIIPRYNTLDPKVHKAIKKIVKEIVERYGDNKALSGLTIIVNGTNVFSLGVGGVKGGYNDINLVRFQKDTGIKILVYDTEDIYRFAKSYQWLMKNARDAWITWRCKIMHDFYKDIADILTRKRADLKLSIFCPDTYNPNILFLSAEYRNKRSAKKDSLRELGIDLDMYKNDKNIVMSAVTRVSQMYHERGHKGDKMEIESYRTYGLIPEIAEPFKVLPQAGAIFFDTYFEDAIMGTAKITDLAKILPKTQEKGWRCSAINANTFHCLENYVAALNNLDAISITKGGFAIGTVGIEDYIGLFSKAFTTLPAVKFNAIRNLSDPVRARQKIVDGKNYFYLLNRLPFEVKVNLKLSKGSSATSLITLKSTPMENIVLQPYELKTFSSPGDVKVTTGSVVVNKEVVNNLKSSFAKAKKSFNRLKRNGVPMVHYSKFLNAAAKCLKEKKYARLHLLLQESWVNDIKKLLKDSNLQEFLKVDVDFIEQQNRRRKCRVKKADGTIIIDGKLNEKTWEKAEIIDDLAEFFKFKGKLLAKPAARKTTIRFLHDDKNIYLGITCDNPESDKIIVKKGLKDAPLWTNDSSVEFFLKGDNMAKGKCAQMATNAGSSKTEILGGGVGSSWNPEWQTKSIIIPGKGWQCEIAVPLKEIGKTDSNNLLFNLARHCEGTPKMALCFINQSGGLFCEDIWTELQFEK